MSQWNVGIILSNRNDAMLCASNQCDRNCFPALLMSSDIVWYGIWPAKLLWPFQSFRPTIMASDVNNVFWFLFPCVGVSFSPFNCLWGRLLIPKRLAPCWKLIWKIAWLGKYNRLPITRIFKGNRKKFELAGVQVISSTSQMTGKRKWDGEWMQVTCTLQRLINTQCWTLYLNLTNKKVKTKNTWLLK